jgi:hypothetical protein
MAPGQEVRALQARCGPYTGEQAVTMATAKEEVRRLLESLPDDASLEDVQYSIYVRERIERGRREGDDGKLIEQDEVESRMCRWVFMELSRV